MKKSKELISKTPSDIAEALGLTPAHAIEWELRKSVTKKIIEVVEKNSITVTKLAKESGTSRGRITRILKEDTDGISLDVLVRILGAAGQKIKLAYRKVA